MAFTVIPATPETTDFVVAPADSPVVVQGLPGDWLQIQEEGADVGDANVAVVDFVGDPSKVLATRGVGENSHIITVRMAPTAPVGDPAVLYICCPGPQYPTASPLLTGDSSEFSANTANDAITTVEYTEPASPGSMQRYIFGWQSNFLTPAVAATVTITEGTDFSNLKIGFNLQTGGAPYPGPYTTIHGDNGVEFYIKGTGGIYTYNVGTATETLIQATAALAVNDQIGLKMDDWQYGAAYIKLNGAAEVTVSNIGRNFFVEGAAGLAPSAVQPAACCAPMLQDNFTGTGLLSAHSPEYRPSGFVWALNSAGTMTLDGTGLVKPTTSAFTEYRADGLATPWTEMPTTTTFSLTLVATMPG